MLSSAVMPIMSIYAYHRASMVIVNMLLIGHKKSYYLPLACQDFPQNWIWLSEKRVLSSLTLTFFVRRSVVSCEIYLVIVTIRHFMTIIIFVQVISCFKTYIYQPSILITLVVHSNTFLLLSSTELFTSLRLAPLMPCIVLVILI